MIYRFLADIVVLIHFGFIVFVVLGGLLVLRWKRVAWIHLPAALWGAAIEYFGWICPLTPIELSLHEAGGERGYETGFIDHYLVPIIYPPGLTRELQLGLGLGVLLVNALVYATVIFRSRQRARREQ